MSAAVFSSFPRPAGAHAPKPQRRPGVPPSSRRNIINRKSDTNSSDLALVEAAGETLLAAFLVDEGRLAALRAELGDLPLAVPGRDRRFRRRLDVADGLGQRRRQRIGQREDLAGSEARRLAAADPRELADDLLEPPLRRERRREPEDERNQPSERLRDGHRVGAALAHLDEDLERILVRGLVDRDERGPDGRLGAVRRALEAPRPRPDDRGPPAPWDRLALVLLADADVQHLLALAAVAEHRDAEAAELPRERVGPRHVGLRRVVREVDRLRDALVGGALER